MLSWDFYMWVDECDGKQLNQFNENPVSCQTKP